MPKRNGAKSNARKKLEGTLAAEDFIGGADSGMNGEQYTVNIREDRAGIQMQPMS